MMIRTFVKRTLSAGEALAVANWFLCSTSGAYKKHLKLHGSGTNRLGTCHRYVFDVTIPRGLETAKLGNPKVLYFGLLIERQICRLLCLAALVCQT